MRTNLLRLAALLAFATSTAACATPGPLSVNPPRLTLPRLAIEPCKLPTLPDTPTEADLEAAYALRGSAVVQCDAARDLAVQTLISERELQDRWRQTQAPKPFWRVW